jgi:hypothetical protein
MTRQSGQITQLRDRSKLEEEHYRQNSDDACVTHLASRVSSEPRSAMNSPEKLLRQAVVLDVLVGRYCWCCCF